MLRIIAACLLLSPLSAQQTLPDGKELWKQSDEALAKYRSYQCELDIGIDIVMGGNPVHVKMASSIAMVNPDKMRVETKSEMFATTTVSDGKDTWFYVPAKMQYTRKPSSRQGLRESLNIPGNTTEASNKMMATARTVRQESIQIDGTSYSCWVIESTADRVVQAEGSEMTGVVGTVWIDKDLKILRQLAYSATMRGGQVPGPVEMKWKTVVRALKLDVDLPDSLFKFTPPPGAKQVDEVDAAESETSSLAGKAAPSLSVKSLAGETFDLANLKGKIVLLEFWATWCGPCRKEMPIVDKIHKEFKDSGLVVLGLNVDEERVVVERFLKTANVSYPVALTADADIERFQVSEIPTYVVIDREGKVAAYQIGGDGEATLRQALAKAGLKATPHK